MYLTLVPLALSLLHNLLYEPLGYRLPLPHVPWLDEYATIHTAMLWTNAVNAAMGILFVYQNSQPIRVWADIPYFSISVSLNVLLTLMIVIRLILHTRKTRTALGMTGVGGLCKSVVTMLVESCALCAVNSLLVIGPLGAGTYAVYIFMPILVETQVGAFPSPQSSDSLSNATTDWTGHCSTAHHPTSRQQERVNEQHYCLRTPQLVQISESGGVDG